MKLRFVWVGKTKSQPLKLLIDDYSERLRRFSRIEIVEIRDGNGGEETALSTEAEDICKRLEGDPFVVLLDECGRALASVEFAAFLQEKMTKGYKRISFVLGSHSGVGERVRQRADMLLSLSRMTLTHEMARLILLEQVYRANTIIQGLKYQK